MHAAPKGFRVDVHAVPKPQHACRRPNLLPPNMLHAPHMLAPKLLAPNTLPPKLLVGGCRRPRLTTPWDPLHRAWPGPHPVWNGAVG